MACSSLSLSLSLLRYANWYRFGVLVLFTVVGVAGGPLVLPGGGGPWWASAVVFSTLLFATSATGIWTFYYGPDDAVKPTAVLLVAGVFAAVLSSRGGGASGTKQKAL